MPTKRRAYHFPEVELRIKTGEQEGIFGVGGTHVEVLAVDEEQTHAHQRNARNVDDHEYDRNHAVEGVLRRTAHDVHVRREVVDTIDSGAWEGFQHSAAVSKGRKAPVACQEGIARAAPRDTRVREENEHKNSRAPARHVAVPWLEFQG